MNKHQCHCYTCERNLEIVQKIREWYGINQIHIPSDEAVKMIKILGDES